VDLVSEGDERFPAGPRGAKGERGERGLSRLQGRAVVFLFGLAFLGTGGNLFWTAHEIGANNRQFCQVITGFTAVPVQKPADPSANPSRVNDYEWYLRFASLGRSLGC